MLNNLSSIFGASLVVSFEGFTIINPEEETASTLLLAKGTGLGVVWIVSSRFEILSASKLLVVKFIMPIVSVLFVSAGI